MEIPTRVGMDRVMRSPAAHDARDPHARGDGPAAHSRMVAWMARSPRAWGWTVDRHRLLGCPEEIPTRVGMDRAVAVRRVKAE